MPWRCFRTSALRQHDLTTSGSETSSVSVIRFPIRSCGVRWHKRYTNSSTSATSIPQLTTGRRFRGDLGGVGRVRRLCLGKVEEKGGWFRRPSKQLTIPGRKSCTICFSHGYRRLIELLL